MSSCCHKYHRPGNLEKKKLIFLSVVWHCKIKMLCIGWFCVNLIQARAIREEGTSIQNMPPFRSSCKAFSQSEINGGARQWWHKPLIPALGRQRQLDFWVRGQPGLQSAFQDSWNYTEKPCLEKPKKKKMFGQASGLLLLSVLGWIAGWGTLALLNCGWLMGTHMVFSWTHQPPCISTKPTATHPNTKGFVCECVCVCVCVCVVCDKGEGD
jgi:hypothetical protein